jgi:hypothetical protein
LKKEKATMKLKVRTTHTLTTDDLEMFCDPPLTFEAVGSIDPRTSRDLSTWHSSKFPEGQAVDFVPKLFLSVAQNGTSYPLTTVEDARALQEAVGEKFVSRLVLSYWNYQATYFEKKQAASVSLSPESGTGNGSEPTP